MITDHEYEQLSIMVQGSGWKEVVKPRITALGNEAVKALCDPANKRTGTFEGHSDDMLRGCILACEYVLKSFENEVTVHRMNRLRDQISRNGTEADPN